MGERSSDQKGSIAALCGPMAFSCFARIRGMSGTLTRVRVGRKGVHRCLHHPSALLWLYQVRPFRLIRKLVKQL
jgi:hypothetical protein